MVGTANTFNEPDPDDGKKPGILERVAGFLSFGLFNKAAQGTPHVNPPGYSDNEESLKLEAEYSEDVYPAQLLEGSREGPA